MNNFFKIFSKTDQPDNNELEIQAIGFHAACDYQIWRGTVVAYRIILFHQAMRLTWANREILTKPNTLFIFPRQSSVMYTSVNCKHWTHSWIRLEGTSVEELIKYGQIPFEQPIYLGDSHDTDKWLPIIGDEMDSPFPDYQVIMYLLKILLHSIAKKTRDIDLPQVPDFFLKAKLYLDNNFSKHITLAKISRHVGLSSAYLCDGFKHYFNVPPIEYVLRLRFNKAIILLEDHNLNISNIAIQSGFNDIYYFSKLFRKRFGCSPTQYRQKKIE